MTSGLGAIMALMASMGNKLFWKVGRFTAEGGNNISRKD
jgi:hypothetical protein